MTGCWVGLDVGDRTIRLCAIGDAGQVIHEADCDPDALAVAAALRGLGDIVIHAVALEAGGNGHLVRQLKAADVPIIRFETRQASSFLRLRRNKTDAIDALGLAELARIGSALVSKVWTRGREASVVRTHLAVRHRLVVVRVGLENLLRTSCAQHGVRLTFGRRDRAVQDALSRIDEFRDAGLEDLVSFTAVSTIVTALRKEISACDRRLADLAQTIPECRRFMTVPGVGALTALSFYSLIEDPSRFPVNAAVGPYLGLTPTTKQSGTVRRSGRISRMGNKATRTHLFNAAKSLLFISKTDCALKRWGLALRERTSARKATIGLARKIAVLLLHLWKTGDEFKAFPH